MVKQNGYRYDFQFDSEGRVTQIISTYGDTRNITTNYIYTSDALQLNQRSDSSGFITYDTITGILNENGYIVSSSDGFNYEYDDNGYQIKVIHSEFVTTNVWSDGNLLISTWTSELDSTWSSVSYEYDPENVDYRDYGRGYNGKRSRNLLISQTYSNSQGMSHTISHLYQKDSKGRVSKEEVFNDSVKVNEFVFTYLD